MPPNKLNFSFDRRVSETYNQVRAYPEDIAPKIGEAIAGLTGPQARILELGIGTGRIALPVASAGCNVVGVDISSDMLQHVSVSAAERGLNVLAAQADIARLPFTANTFDAITTVHVLHLVPDWQSALAGAIRALKPKGCLILGRDWVDPDSMAGELQTVFRKTVVELMGPQLKAPTSGAVMATYIEEVGGSPEHLGPTDLKGAEWETHESPASVIASIRTRTFPESWILTDEFMDPVVARVQAHAASRWADLDQRFAIKRAFLMSVFRKD